MESFMTTYGSMLIAGGFPILPIVPGEKFPGRFERSRWLPYKGWTKHATRATTIHELNIWQQWPDAGIGIATGTVAGIDIDIMDDTVSEQLQQLAFNRLGVTPAVRIGRYPKRLLVYRTSEPFKGIKAHPLEVLCLGQQFVAYAIHPATGKPYEWPVRSLAELTLAELPALTEEQARVFIEQGLALLPEQLRPSRIEHNQPVSPAPQSLSYPSNDLEGTPEAILEALRYIPNTDLPYNDWVRIGMAIKGAIGEYGASFFVDWSASSSKNQPETTATAWREFKPTVIGAGTLYYLAKRNGWKPDPSLVFNPAHGHYGAHPAAQLLHKVQQSTAPVLHKVQQEASVLGDDEPFDPLTVHGLVGDLTRYIAARAESPLPLLIFGHVLTALGALMGRRYRTETDLRSNLYVIGLAPTGAGKNHSRVMITSLFEQANLSQFMGGDEIGSGSGLISSLERQPSILYMQDEFGIFMRDILGNGRARMAAYVSKIHKLLLQLFTTANSTFQGVELSKANPNGSHNPIVDPCLCIYGTGTPETFWSAFTQDQIDDGFLPRFLVLQVDQYPEEQDTPLSLLDKFPQELIERCRRIQDGGSYGSGNLSGTIIPGVAVLVEPTIVPMEDAAKSLVQALKKEVNQLRRQDPTNRSNAFLTRLVEHVLKVSLVLGVATCPERPVIRAVDVDTAMRFARNSTRLLIRKADECIMENQVAREKQQILNVIKKSAEEWVSKTYISDRTRGISIKVRDEILLDYVNNGVLEELQQTTKTRPALFYRVMLESQ
ncbi:MAG: PriCT-2 domain-containing protein [Magnetococcales bacterium]|nr:PriCT-2 domain-containing protein [Magnetococcales bacterium]